MTGRCRGFTLLEMIVVISIMSILLALTAGAYVSLRNSLRREGTVDALEATLRRARHFALSAGAPSEVRVDGQNLTVWSVGFEIVGQWHFEDETFSGAFGIDALAAGGSRHPGGKIGYCIAFGDAPAYIELGREYDLSDGGLIEAYFRPLRYTTGPQVLFARGGDIRVWMDSDGILHARLGSSGGIECSTAVASARPPTAAAGLKPTRGTKATKEKKKPAKAPLVRGTYRLPLYTWTKVGLQWTSRKDPVAGYVTEMALLVNDIVRAEARQTTGGTAIAAKSKDPITLGDKDTGLIGRVDEARILAAVADGDPWRLPANAEPLSFRAQFRTIHFDAQGQLDRRYHAAPVTLSFVMDRTHQVDIIVGMQGIVENRWSKDEPPMNAESIETAEERPPSPRLRRTGR